MYTSKNSLDSQQNTKCQHKLNNNQIETEMKLTMSLGQVHSNGIEEKLTSNIYTF